MDDDRKATAQDLSSLSGEDEKNAAASKEVNLHDIAADRIENHADANEGSTEKTSNVEINASSADIRESNTDKKEGNTKNEILDAALRLFSSYGFHKTTMDMIAREANVAKGTLYWYFSSKKSLFVGLLESDLERFYSYLEGVKNDTTLTSCQKLEAIIDSRFDFFEKHQAVVREVMSHKDEIDTDFACQMESLRNRHINLLTAIFAEGQTNAEFAIDDPQVVAVAFMGMNMAIASYNQFVAEEQREWTTRVLKNLILNGILQK